jgi:nucleoside-diphosphate-sugar epimerase
MAKVNEVNILGGYGFVGQEYCNVAQQHHMVIRNLKNNYEVVSPHCVYFISTVDNYNVHKDVLLDVNTNIVILLQTLDRYRRVCEKSNEPGCFNFISSWFVYGQDSGFDGGHPPIIGETSRGIPETDPCEPKGFYSITKRTAEQLLISYCETFNLNYRILRLANVLGKEDKKVSAKKNALQYLLGELKENKPIDLYDSGYFYRDYIDVRDCARAIDLVVNEGKLDSIYNIGNGKPIVFREVIRYAKHKLNSTSELRTIEQKQFHKKVQSSRSFFMDNSKLQSLGYSPKYTLYETIDDIIS